ncbi:putative membrane protein, partial [Chlamydia psittaci 06-1683]
QNKP